MSQSIVDHVEPRESIIRKLSMRGFLSQFASFDDANDKMSDSEVKVAVAHYQRYHGLTSDGVFGRGTQRHTNLTRICSHPDIMPMELTDVRARWPDKNIRWALLNPADFQGIDAATVQAAISWAFGQWALVCGINPVQTSDPSQAHVLIECQNIDSPGNVLAWSELADGSMNVKHQRFDHMETWCYVSGTAVPRDMRIDLGRVACHELGHVLGIPHIQAGNLMQPTYSYSIWTPQAGDIAEAQGRYGKPVNAPPTPPPPPPVPSGSWTITLTGSGPITGASIPGYRVTPLA